MTITECYRAINRLHEECGGPEPGLLMKVRLARNIIRAQTGDLHLIDAALMLELYETFADRKQHQLAALALQTAECGAVL